MGLVMPFRNSEPVAWIVCRIYESVYSVTIYSGFGAWVPFY